MLLNLPQDVIGNITQHLVTKQVPIWISDDIVFAAILISSANKVLRNSIGIDLWKRVNRLSSWENRLFVTSHNPTRGCWYKHSISQNTTNDKRKKEWSPLGRIKYFFFEEGKFDLTYTIHPLKQYQLSGKYGYRFLLEDEWAQKWYQIPDEILRKLEWVCYHFIQKEKWHSSRAIRRIARTLDQEKQKTIFENYAERVQSIRRSGSNRFMGFRVLYGLYLQDHWMTKRDSDRRLWQ